MISQPPLGSIVTRVKEVIANLSKKKRNHIKSTAELNQLIAFCNRRTTLGKNSNQNQDMSSGASLTSNRIPIISTLLNDLDFGDPRTITAKDDQKVFYKYCD